MATLDADTLLKAYAAGVFPMAASRDDPNLYWFDPDKRAVIPLDEGFHVPRRLQRTLRTSPYLVSADQDFAGVMRACAAPRPGHPDTWINAQILRLYSELHGRGRAHSIEVWLPAGDAPPQLVGGLYGVSLGAAFFGESMFSIARDASKVALCALVAWLREGGYVLLDTQYMTDHLSQFGTYEMARQDYRQTLAAAIAQPGRFYSRAPSSCSRLSSMLGFSA